MTTKTCNKCGEEKPLDDFYRYSGRCCKPCFNKRNAARRAAKEKGQLAPWEHPTPTKKVLQVRRERYHHVPDEREQIQKRVRAEARKALDALLAKKLGGPR